MGFIKVDSSYVWVCLYCNRFFSQKEEYVLHIRNKKIKKIKSKNLS